MVDPDHAFFVDAHDDEFVMKVTPQSKIALGLWPIAGITTIGVTPQDARATIAAAIQGGITVFDTAFSYGFDGESDRLLGEFVTESNRDQFTIISKVGQRWNSDRKRIVDGSAIRLTEDAEASLRRLNLEYVDLLFLHAPDPRVPLAESASAFAALQSRGLCRRIGICNASAEQIDQFAGCVSIDAIECPLNLIQRDSYGELIQPSRAAGRDVFVFWTLMKGLLAGKITREHVFQAGDSRPGYEIFQGETRRRVHDVIDRLEALGGQIDQSVAQISVAWAISQPGVTAALVGARRAEQIQEILGTAFLSPSSLAAVDQIVDQCM